MDGWFGVAFAGCITLGGRGAIICRKRRARRLIEWAFYDFCSVYKLRSSWFAAAAPGPAEAAS